MTSPSEPLAKRGLRVGLLIKRSAWKMHVEEELDPRLAKLVKRNDPLVQRIRASHESHEQTVLEVKEVLSRLHARVITISKGKTAFDSDKLDIVVTVGGDGTLLNASHSVVDVPIVGINSAPSHSVGFFCAGERGHVEEVLRKAITGTLKKTELTRMSVRVNGKVVAARVLNDALFCHASPAATSRYVVSFRKIVEHQKSSGFWIGPAAGSTAAQRSAGGKVLPLKSKKLQFVVREPYTPQGESYRLKQCLIDSGQVLQITSKVYDGRIFFDGPEKFVEVGFGDVVEFTQAPESLILFGLRPSRRRVR